MTPVPLEIIETKILKPFKYPRLVHEGYLYHFHKKCNRHLRWKCNRVYSLKCPAVLRTNLDMLNPQCIAVDHEHVHGNDLIAVEQLKLKLRIHQTSTLFKKNTCFKSKDLDKFDDEEINSPDNMLDNKLARFCASMNKVYFIDPLDPDHEYGNAKREEIIKINNSKDTSFNFENCPYTRLQQQNNQKQVIIENGITGNHTNYSSLKKCIKRRRGRPPKAKNMIVSEKKENDTQNNEITLLTNIRKETNILTTDTHKEINNLTAYTRKDKNSLISNVNKIKSSLRNKKNKNTYILTKNNRKGKKSLVSGIKNEKNMSTANSNTSKRSLTNTHTKNNIMTTQKQKNKSSFITNVNKKTISSKVKKYTSTFTNQNSNTIENSPIIISTSTITSTSTTLTSPIKIIPKIEVAPTDLTTTIISTPKIESKFSIESTPTVTSTPIIESLPSIKMAHTIERCMNKSINYEDDIIIISDNEDDDSSFNFFEVDDNEEVNNKINEIDLKDYDFMILTDLKKNWPTIESTPIIESTPKIENTSTITSTPTIISTPIIESTPTITSSTIESIPTIESTPKIENTSTITSTSTIISTSTIECIPTIESTPKIESTPTITSTPTIISNSTIESTPKIESTPTITSIPSIINTPTIANPSIKMAETIERCMNKSIDYDDDIIVISDNEDDGSNFNFFEVNDNEKIDDEINEIDLKDYESMILTDLKKNWPTILNKMSDPFTGIKVFESILFNKLLFRIIQGNIKTKKKLDQYKTSIDHWESKFVCLSQQMKTLVNNIKNDKNTRLINIQDKNVQDTTLCSNIGVDKQTNNIDIKKKVSTELKSDITPDNLKTSKLCQQSLKNKNKYLSESDYDIMTSKSEEIKTNISSTPVKADLIKDIPTDLTITEQNYLIQSDSGIKINQSKDNESNELFTPVSDVTKALELSPKSLKRKISNLIQNNTSIEIIKPKFVKCSEPSSLAFIDSTIGSLPDMMNSRLSPKLLNSQIKNFTHHSTAIEMTESNKTEYYEPSTSASIDATVNNLPAITNSRLSVEKNIFTQYSNDTEIIPSISISTDLSSNIPTFSSSSMRAITPLNDKAITPPLCIDASSNVEILKNSKISTMKLKRKNSEEWTSPRKITVYPKTGSSIGRSIFLPFAIKQILKSNKHSPSQPIIINKLLKYSYKTIQLDKRDILNTPIIPVQMKTPLPDVVYESTQIMNEINCKETIQSKYLHDQHKSPNQVKSVPKAIPLLPSEIIDDFSNKV